MTDKISVLVFWESRDAALLPYSALPSRTLIAGSTNTRNDMAVIPMPEAKNHFSTPISSAKRPEHNKPRGIANDITLPSKEKTLPKYSGLIFS